MMSISGLIRKLNIQKGLAKSYDMAVFEHETKIFQSSEE